MWCLVPSVHILKKLYFSHLQRSLHHCKKISYRKFIKNSGLRICNFASEIVKKFPKNFIYFFIFVSLKSILLCIVSKGRVCDCGCWHYWHVTGDMLYATRHTWHLTSHMPCGVTILTHLEIHCLPLSFVLYCYPLTTLHSVEGKYWQCAGGEDLWSLLHYWQKQGASCLF